jgi:hypothetical protein
MKDNVCHIGYSPSNNPANSILIQFTNTFFTDAMPFTYQTASYFKIIKYLNDNVTVFSFLFCQRVFREWPILGCD